MVRKGSSVNKVILNSSSQGEAILVSDCNEYRQTEITALSCRLDRLGQQVANVGRWMTAGRGMS